MNDAPAPPASSASAEPGAARPRPNLPGWWRGLLLRCVAGSLVGAVAWTPAVAGVATAAPDAPETAPAIHAAAPDGGVDGGVDGVGGGGACVAAVAQVVVHSLQADAEIEPVRLLPVGAVGSGVVADLRVVPGSVVAAGEVLARLGGPELRARQVQREQDLRGAAARAAAADHALDAARRELAAQLVTRQAVAAAEADAVAAGAAVRVARARLQQTRSEDTVRAPVAATVVAVQAADGQVLAAGQTIVTLQPTAALWLRAAYYGADAALLRVGMRGRFEPSGGQPAVAVEVAAIAPALSADGGVRVGLVPTAAARPSWWLAGQWGRLVLDGPATRMVMVPTEALILDRGRWWVMLHTAAGDRPQQVVPGPARGWRTAIVSGLAPGQQVVATDAFLAYHRGIAAHYAPPD